MRRKALLSRGVPARLFVSRSRGRGPSPTARRGFQPEKLVRVAPNLGDTILDFGRFDAILGGWRGTMPSPCSPSFDPRRLRRVQMTGRVLEQTLDWLDQPGRGYISNGDPGTSASRATHSAPALPGALGVPRVSGI